MRGAECSFSSIDNHTQHTYSKLHRGVLGLVIEIQSNGKKGVFDFFELSRFGEQEIERCSRSKYCITTAQHDSCMGKEFYQSAMDKVTFDDFYTINVSNFISKITDNCQNPQKAIAEMHMEVEETSDDIIKPENPHPKKKTDCSNCKKKCVNLILHLSRTDDCREFYGDEFDAMKKERDEKVKATKRKRERNRYSQNYLKKRKQNADYKSANAERLKEDHRRYNTINAPIINVSTLKI